MEDNHLKILRFSLELDTFHATKSSAKEERKKKCSHLSNFLFRNFMQRVNTSRGDDNDPEKKASCMAEIKSSQGKERLERL